MTQSRMLPAGDATRARMILLLADGLAYQKIQDLLDTTAPTISRWKRRFLDHRIAGLMEELHPGQQPSVRTPKPQAKVLAAIKEARLEREVIARGIFTSVQDLSPKLMRCAEILRRAKENSSMLTNSLYPAAPAT
jgi:transposase